MCLALLRFGDWQRDRERECSASGFDACRFEADLQLLCDGIDAFLGAATGQRLLLLLCPTSTDQGAAGGAAGGAAAPSTPAAKKEVVRAPPGAAPRSTEEFGVLRIRVQSASGLKAADKGGTSDPYACPNPSPSPNPNLRPARHRHSSCQP